MPFRAMSFSWGASSKIQGLVRAAFFVAAKVGPDRELDGGGPETHQVAERIRHLIMSGEVTEGSELVSAPELAACVGVDPQAVARAYRSLEEDGLLDLSEGVRVRGARGFAAQSPEVVALERQLRDVVSRLVLCGAKRPEIERLFFRVLQRLYGSSHR